VALRCPSHSQPNPTLSPCCSLSRPWATSTRKQPRNRMQNHTCLQRHAGVRARDGNSGYGQPKGGQNHSQVDDLWACFEAPEWKAFCHTERLRNSPARLRLVLSDNTTKSQNPYGAQLNCALRINMYQSD
jgi:hypothetical protein